MSLRPHLLSHYNAERFLMWCASDVSHSYLKLHSAGWASQVNNSTTESCTRWGQWNMKMRAVLLDVVIASWAISEDTECVLVKAWDVFWGRIMGFCLIFVRLLVNHLHLLRTHFLFSSLGGKKKAIWCKMNKQWSGFYVTTRCHRTEVTLTLTDCQSVS